MSQEYKVKLEVFEGPLDLLLFLIKRDEVDIYDIPIEHITKQYLDFMELFKMLDLDVAGEFVVMAANLIYIKSRALLPVHAQPPDEEAEEEDPRWELVRQLLEYKKFKDAAAQLGQREADRQGIFARAAESAEPAPERPLGEVSVFDLEHFTVADKIDLILKITAGGVALKFTEMFAEAASRGEIVVTFLAMLELVRLKQLRCVQPEPFAEIEIVRV
jgi:segregation and condensation protein A